MKLKFIIIIIIIMSVSYSQSPDENSYSWERAIYKAKEYVMTELIGADSLIIKFEIEYLATSAFGELTTLVYNCEQKNLRGLILSFFGSVMNEYGVTYQTYAFKNISKKEADILLSRLSKIIVDNKDYLNNNKYTNNIFFQYDDLIFLIYSDKVPTIRVFWNNFDSEWDWKALEKTRRKFKYKINN